MTIRRHDKEHVPMIEKIHTVAVIGAGYMGGGIAQALAQAGFDVTIADVSAEVAQEHLERILRETAQAEAQGLFPDGTTGSVRQHLRAASSIEEAVADADFVEEAVSEVPTVKHDVLRRISGAARPDAIIGSNTSTIPVAVMEEAVSDPRRFLTVHWSNPAPFIPGIELVTGERTDPAVVPVVQDMLTRAGRSSALVADVPGFVLNRLQFVLLKEAMTIVEEGVATQEDVDTIVRSTFGFRLPFFGPFEIAEMAGLDVYANSFETFREAFGERLAPPVALTDAVAAGRHGTKNGKGLLRDYTPQEVDDLVAYRSLAYSRMAALLAEIGPAPTRR
ncbi:3-hydroxyacyl-CoA dehydrogenase family protein [Actinotalea sp. K2]|uniref:3-hydroxyacyl-CoA dehydrogenase family protein n=1 Tax=Actinotalea sp. K2 TaxID=2939438 RepID=UPI002017C212|nr:3-hydroxyacyl-CoA dehydrogenase family protein [Actinotalea sp. K2]MCL3859823.1 3-hydroxyacyl-CoA dehydrogenase family protein [Actinotalea sp. K2]